MTTASIASPIMDSLLDQRPHRRAVRAAIRRVKRDLEAARSERYALLADYEDGLPGERQAAVQVSAVCTAVTQRAKQAARAAYLSRVGRRIDLVAILALSRQDGSAAWTVADPCDDGASGAYVFSMGGPGVPAKNTAYMSDIRAGDIIGQNVVVSARQKGAVIWTPHCRGTRSPGNIGTRFSPTGMPPIPPRVRALATDRKIRRRAKFVGVLYQPTAWEQLQPNPDPALVVEWKDRPGEYYAVAVWGHDGPRIMEFVD